MQVEKDRFCAFSGNDVMLPGVTTFKEKLTRLAELRDWSISKVASHAKVSQPTLHKAMNGQKLRVDAAIRVADVMDVTVEWLFNDRKDWKDLPRRPFWLPPHLDPGAGVALDRLDDELGDIVRRKHGIEDASRSGKPAARSPTGAKAEAPRRRRKSTG